MSPRQWFWFSLLALVIVVASFWIPAHLISLGKHADYVAAYGTWVAAGVVAALGLLAIPQLDTAKRSVDVDVFLKVCAEIDDTTFGRNYELCRRERAKFKTVTISDDNRLSLSPDDPALRKSALDVLYTLEEVGIIFHHSVLNKDMVAEYVGEVVVNAYAALSPLIAEYQKSDKEMFERVVGLREYCIKNGWTEEVAEALPFTRIE
jgi:hypothetical protein